MVMEMDFTGEDQIARSVMMNQVRKKKPKKTKAKRKSKKKDCGCPK